MCNSSNNQIKKEKEVQLLLISYWQLQHLNGLTRTSVHTSLEDQSLEKTLGDSYEGI